MIQKYASIALGLLMANVSIAQQNEVIPTTSNGKYYLNFADLSVEIDPAVGGRITSFKLGQKETQKKKTNKDDNDFGSSLQPAPQSLWNWPPPPNIDNQPYTASIVRNEVVLVGKEDATLKMAVEKRISISVQDTSLMIEYTLKNNSTKAQSAACWEVTKINSGGLILYPLGTGESTDLAKWTTTKKGIVWYDHDSVKVTTNKGGTFKSDGAEGWCANVQHSGIVFLKKFTDTPANKQAPGENENKVFIRDDNSYLSFELQSTYGAIAANGSTKWAVKWFLRALPNTIKPVAGNDALVNFVKNIGVAPPTAINAHLETTSQAYLTPQPVANEFQVMVDYTKFTVLDITVYDMHGKAVKEYLQVNSKAILQKQDLKQGIYTYTIMHNGQMIGKGKMQVQ